MRLLTKLWRMFFDSPVKSSRFPEPQDYRCSLTRFRNEVTKR
jgi:hypothetical protein